MPIPSINQIALVHSEDPGTPNVTLGRVGVGATEQTYLINNFNPQTDPSTYSDLSWTSARKAQRRYNTYQSTDKYSVFCYVDDWAQYDSRYKVDDNPVKFDTGGRGADYLWLEDSGYDKLVLGFAGIIGFTDPTNSGMNDKLNLAAYEFGIISTATEAAAADAKGSMTFADSWGDVGSYLNCGFDGWVPGTPEELYMQARAQGVFGALTKKTTKRLAFSLGGWTMSWAYSELCNPENSVLQERLIQGIQDFLSRFPRFTHLDLDWEYPGSVGNGIPHTPEDGENFAALIERIYNECYVDGAPIGISIAISANIATLTAANIAGTVNRLAACGVSFNLMSYDLFTLNNNGAINDLGHHTNLLKSSGTSEFSIEAAVDFLIDCGVTPHKIFIGFAGYTRNVRNATLTDITPLRGTYNTLFQSTVGTFEYGVTEFPDLLANYLDLEGMANAGPELANQVQLHSTGFVLCTDTEADADFLYNPTTKLFMSIETPRTVRRKAEYVKDKRLGGLFIWTGDQDSGLLVNAAWEGLGFSPINAEPFDMIPYYNIKGVTSIQELDNLLNRRIPGMKIPRESQYANHR
ncbi:glycoside hydrolase family 18 protein [Enterobacter ludwigii]